MAIPLTELIMYPATRLPCDRLDPDALYGANHEWALSEVLNYLILVGYLTYEVDLNGDYFAYIPNSELEEHWKTEVSELFKNLVIPDIKGSEMYSWLATGDYQTVADLFQRAVPGASYYNVSGKELLSESSYHTTIYGILFFSFEHDGDRAVVESDRERKNGRADLVVLLLEEKMIFIFEFKRSPNEARLDQDSNIALNQLDEKNYEHGVPSDWSVIKIGVSFYSKKMSALKIKERLVGKPEVVKEYSAKSGRVNTGQPDAPVVDKAMQAA